MQHEEEQLLLTFKQLTPYFHQLINLFVEDFTIAITDINQYLIYIPGKTLNLGMRDGDKIKQGGLVSNILQSRKSITQIMDKSIFGITYFGGGMPIFDKNQTLVGSIVIGVSVEREHKLMEISTQLSAFVEQVTASSASIHLSAQQVSDKNEYLSQYMGNMKKQIHETSKIVGFIQDIAVQSKILGMNAGIEAYRSNQQGRTFGVIASEIQKMAEHSNDSSKNIIHILKKLNDEIEKLTLLIQESTSLAHFQFKDISELSQSISSVNDELQTLNKLANFYNKYQN